jgi:2-methylcitrate dehydratase PrpD
MEGTMARSGTDLGVTAALAEFAANCTVEALPLATIASARRLLLDACTCMLAGSRSANVAQAATIYRGQSAQAGTVVAHGGGFGAEAAALLNGMSAHECGIDDFHAPSRTHPGAAVVPAALAAAELSHGAANDVLAAIVAGYDVTARISRGVGVTGLFQRGFHPGSVCGALGAAAAAGRVLRLGPAEMLAALDLAASQASGLLTWEDDPTHVVKSFQLGCAARSGLVSALFASHGLLPQVDVLTGKHGMLMAFGGRIEPAAFDSLGTEFVVDGMTIKRHAGCGQLHAAIDAVLDIRAEPDFAITEVERIEVALADDALRATDGTALLTHNLHYVLALAAIHGCVVPEHFAEPSTTDPNVRDLAQRVVGHADPELQARFPAYQSAIVTVHSAGAVWRRDVAMPHGGPDSPLTEAELWQKFDTMAGADPMVLDGVRSALGAQPAGLDIAALIQALGEPADLHTFRAVNR